MSWRALRGKTDAPESVPRPFSRGSGTIMFVRMLDLDMESVARTVCDGIATRASAASGRSTKLREEPGSEAVHDGGWEPVEAEPPRTSGGAQGEVAPNCDTAACLGDAG